MNMYRKSPFLLCRVSHGAYQYGCSMNRKLCLMLHLSHSKFCMYTKFPFLLYRMSHVSSPYGYSMNRKLCLKLHWSHLKLCMYRKLPFPVMASSVERRTGWLYSAGTAAAGSAALAAGPAAPAGTQGQEQTCSPHSCRCPRPQRCCTARLLPGWRPWTG